MNTQTFTRHYVDLRAFDAWLNRVMRLNNKFGFGERLVVNCLETIPRMN